MLREVSRDDPGDRLGRHDQGVEHRAKSGRGRSQRERRAGFSTEIIIIIIIISSSSSSSSSTIIMIIISFIIIISSSAPPWQEHPRGRVSGGTAYFKQVRPLRMGAWSRAGPNTSNNLRRETGRSIISYDAANIHLTIQR